MEGSCPKQNKKIEAHKRMDAIGDSLPQASQLSGRPCVTTDSALPEHVRAGTWAHPDRLFSLVTQICAAGLSRLTTLTVRDEARTGSRISAWVADKWVAVSPRERRPVREA